MRGQSAGRPQARVARIPEGVASPIIDGHLDEHAWALAGELGRLTEVEPFAGSPPSERTEVLLCHDETALFIAVRCHDSDPDGIRATQKTRDARLNPDDRFELWIDPFLDRRNAFWFQMSPAGSRGDALISRNGTVFNKRWDGIWYGRSRRCEWGWLAEMRIPFSTLKFAPGQETWGFNIRRFVRRRNEELRWASPTPRIGFFTIAEGGLLHGFEGIRQGFGVDFRPFGVADARRDNVANDTDGELDLGFDLFYSLDPKAKLSLSFNTDFAETEVDERQVNLTRFPLFFPERRDFFLEDSGVFEFGGGSDDNAVIPFFSRRIGIDDGGEEVPLLASAKVTATTDSYSLGLLDVQADETGSVESENLFAGRFSKNIFRQSDVGVIWTHGNPTAPERNDTFGADLNLRTTRFLGDKTLRFSAWALRADGEGVSEHESAYSARLQYPNDVLRLTAEALVVEENFDPRLGFVRRRDIKRYRGTFDYRPRLQSSVVRRLVFGLRPELVTDSGNDTQSVDVRLTPFGIDWQEGDEARLEVTHRREVLDEDFDITDDVTIDSGAYSFTRVGASFETTSARPWSLDLNASTGDFFGGTQHSLSAGLDLRHFSVVNLGFEYEFDDVDQPAGDFHVHVARARFNFQFTPDLAWSNFFQYDNQSDALGLNSRLWWIFEPGRELFFVVNQGWQVLAGDVATTSSQATLKVGYTMRF